MLRCPTLALARRAAVRGLRRDRIGRVIVVAAAAAGDSRHTQFVEVVEVEAVVDSRSLRLLAASDSQRIGPAIAIVGSLWRGG